MTVNGERSGTNTSGTGKAMPKRRALLIGTERYEDTAFASLRAPQVDLDGLREVLKTPEICGFDVVDTLLDAAFGDVQLAVTRFFAEASRDDLLLLYFSGHGVVDAYGRLYLCLRTSLKTLLSGTALRASAVCEEMDTCRSQRQIVILDCCHAGAFIRGSKGGGLGESAGTMAAFEGNGRGRIVLAASDATQFAFEGDRVVGHARASLFTHFLVEGLRTGHADTDGSGTITVDELFEYAYAKVVQAEPGQTPEKWTYKQRGDLVLAQNPNPKALPALIDAGIIESIAPGKPFVVRQAAVRELGRCLVDVRPGVVLAARDLLRELRQDDSRSIASLAAEALDVCSHLDVGGLETRARVTPTSFASVVSPMPGEMAAKDSPPQPRSTSSRAYRSIGAVLGALAFISGATGIVWNRYQAANRDSHAPRPVADLVGPPVHSAAGAALPVASISSPSSAPSAWASTSASASVGALPVVTVASVASTTPVVALASSPIAHGAVGNSAVSPSLTLMLKVTEGDEAEGHAAVQRIKPRLVACGKSSKSGTSGRFDVQIATDGSVSVRVHSSNTLEERVVACLSQQLKATRFPQSSGRPPRLSLIASIR